MKELKVRQVCLIIVAFLPVTKFFMMFSEIARYASNDMWISVILNQLIDLFAVLSVIYVYKKTNKSFIELLKEKLGNTVTKVVLSFYLAYFIIKSLVPLSEQKDYVILTLYITMPKIMYFLPFFFMSYYLCMQKIRTLGRASDLLWIVMIMGIAMLLVLSFKNAEFSSILPINYHNTSGIFKGSYHALNWFGDGLYFLFIVGEFQKEKKWEVKIIISYLISFAIVLLFAILFYAIFTSISYRQRFAMTEVSKYSSVISNTGRFDYIGIILILFVNVFALCLPMFFASRLIKVIFNIQKSWLCSLIVNVTLALVLLFADNYFYQISQFIINYCGYFFLIMANIIPILLLTFTKKFKGVKNEILEN